MRDKGYGRELSAENIYLNFFCFSLSCFGEESNNGIKEAEGENEDQEVWISNQHILQNVSFETI